MAPRHGQAGSPARSVLLGCAAALWVGAGCGSGEPTPADSAGSVAAVEAARAGAAGAGSEESEQVKEAEAIERAQAAAREANYSTEGHSVTARTKGDQVEIRFVPTDTTRLGGGLVVSLDGETGEVLRVVRQQ